MPTAEKMKFLYPEARRDDNLKETFFGIEVADPYRWLEDPDSEETKNFVDAQNSISEPYLKGCLARDKIKARLTQMLDYPKYSPPEKEGNHYFYFMNTGLQNHSVLYMQDSLDGESKVFLDPNTFSEDGTVALTWTSFSEDSKIMAYSISKSGSDWCTIHFRKVDTGEDFPEELKFVKFGQAAWTHDNIGVFYTRFPEVEGKSDGSETSQNRNQKIYYHKVGTSQAEDILVVELDDPEYIYSVYVSDCGRWLVVLPLKFCHNNLIYFSDLSTLTDGIKGKLEVTCIVDKFEADYEFVANTGSKFVFRTNRNAPNYKLITIDFENYAEENWVTLVPEHATDVLEQVACVAQDKLVLSYIRDVKNMLDIHSLVDGSLIKKIPGPIGTVCVISGSKKHPELFYTYISFTSPGTIFRCDLSQSPIPDPEVFRQITIPDYDPSIFEEKQVFYTSKDGTQIPMFLVHKKGIEKNGKNPCLVYGYGGFNISLLPMFSTIRLVFIQNFNGIFVSTNIRGGGEYGEKWHDGGRLFNKQNSFDDFTAAGEYLIDEKYTSKELLAIQGGSNGGLLIGASVIQRPDLFAAGIAQVAVLDMLRYHKFTIGSTWASDYGNPEQEEHFKNLIKYSPLHNIKVPEDQYPALLLLTASHDDRVVPLHSLKFIAEMHHKIRNHPKQKNPIMIQVETKAGHGAGKPTNKRIEEQVDILCFLMNSMGLNFTE
ncbi:prolyl endopeptidase isoform X2 [Halyomorpha halys]|uniref:prolyl endopeptidase isoform X2 n=1 Tax=Halyomorpha halys TaxID=286706 RepID=UPI0006D4F4B1|nr:prolyl endopeptidase isoform X2 [Halyomorpha halys]